LFITITIAQCVTLVELEMENRESAAVDESLRADMSALLSDTEDIDGRRHKDRTPTEDDFDTIKLISNGAYAYVALNASSVEL